MRHPARPLLAASIVLLLGTATPVDLYAQTVADQSVGAPKERPAAATTSILEVVEDAIADFRRIPSWQNLAILTVGGIGAATAHSADHDVTAAMTASGSMEALRAGETVGGARTQLAAALATYTIGRITGHERVAAVGADLIGAQIVTQAMTAALKMSVGRTRPDGTQYSFPSGHSSVTFATATVLQRNFGWKVGIPAYGLATYVAASRVRDKRHFLSDVTFGAALGIVAGRSVTVGSGQARFAVSPVAAPGGAAVSFNWTPAN